MHDANDNHAVVTRRVIIHHSITVSYLNVAHKATFSLPLPRGTLLHVFSCFLLSLPQKIQKIKKNKKKKAQTSEPLFLSSR